jgi:hypothetical protein
MFLAGLTPAVTSADSHQPSQVYFDPTGQVVGEPFLSYWLDRNGAQSIGDPVSPPVMVDERWVQWFEYARLEVSTPTLADATANDVRVAPVGAMSEQPLQFLRFHPAFTPVSATDSPDTLFFQETGHTLANAFRGAWESGDTSERLGPPVSEEFRIRDTVYQYFERGALSWNPDFSVSVVPTGLIDAAANGQLQLTGSQPAGVPSYTELVGRPRPGGAGERWIDVNLSRYILTAY